MTAALATAAADAAIVQVMATDAPVGHADALVAAVTGSALKAIVAARVRLFLAGHCPDNDEMLPLQLLPGEARRHAATALAAIGLTDADRDLAAAEASLATTAALCMAAIDRLRMARGAS